MPKKNSGHSIILCSFLYAITFWHTMYPHNCPKKCENNTKKKYGLTRGGRFIVESVQDIFAMHANLLTWDTFKVGCGTFPFYVATAMFEHDIHTWSYCRKHHKNICQIWKGLHRFAVDFSVGAIAGFSTACFIFSHDKQIRETAKLFLIGVPFVIFMADLIKKIIKTEMCYRPWNEKYSSVCRSFGGFPSTHGAQLGYATALFGMQLGVRYAYPLALLTAFVGFSCINGNRHYASQYVAGIGLGVMYAMAASKVVDSKFLNDVNVGLSCDSRGKPAVNVCWRF